MLLLPQGDHHGGATPGQSLGAGRAYPAAGSGYQNYFTVKSQFHIFLLVATFKGTEFFILSPNIRRDALRLLTPCIGWQRTKSHELAARPVVACN
jgi:hypothetical protein